MRPLLATPLISESVVGCGTQRTPSGLVRKLGPPLHQVQEVVVQLPHLRHREVLAVTAGHQHRPQATSLHIAGSKSVDWVHQEKHCRLAVQVRSLRQAEAPSLCQLAEYQRQAEQRRDKAGPRAAATGVAHDSALCVVHGAQIKARHRQLRRVHMLAV